MILGLAMNGVMTYRILEMLDDDAPALRHSLPCAAIPVRFVMDDPVCADKLVRSMNITNVRILPNGEGDPEADTELSVHLGLIADTVENRSVQGTG